MARKIQYLFLYQAIVSLCMLTLVLTVVELAWVFLYLQEARDRKAPGINLKEF